VKSTDCGVFQAPIRNYIAAFYVVSITMHVEITWQSNPRIIPRRSATVKEV